MAKLNFQQYFFFSLHVHMMYDVWRLYDGYGAKERVFIIFINDTAFLSGFFNESKTEHLYEI